MNRSGGKADYKVYPDSYHVFDGSQRPLWSATQEVYADCGNEFMAPDHSVRVDTGAALRKQEDWAKFFAGCVKRGAWIGGNPEATRQLDRDWTDAVKRRWFGDVPRPDDGREPPA